MGARKSNTNTTSKAHSALRHKNKSRNDRQQRRLHLQTRSYWRRAKRWADTLQREPVVSFFRFTNPEFSNHFRVDGGDHRRPPIGGAQSRRLQFRGKSYLSNEHGYMAHKAMHFGRKDLAQIWTEGTRSVRVGNRVFDSWNPKHIKSWSSQVLKPLERQQPERTKSWDQRKPHLMVALNGAKYKQFAVLRAKLLATGQAFLVESSPNDAYWGAGKHLSSKALQEGPIKGEWHRNQMGRILMQIRDALVEKQQKALRVRKRTQDRLINRSIRRQTAQYVRGARKEPPPTPDEIRAFPFQLCPELRKRHQVVTQGRLVTKKNYMGQYSKYMPIN